MLGIGIGVRIDGNGFHAHALGGCRHPARDFTAVCNQYFFKHGRSPRCNRLRTLRVPRNLASPLRRFAAGHRGWQSGFF